LEPKARNGFGHTHRRWLKYKASVELVLNLVGALVAVGLIGLWLRIGSRSTDRTSHRATQIVALLLLIVILFPVISVTDDLMAAQNPAETDSVQRRNLEASVLHTAVLSAALPIDAFRAPDPQVVWRSRTRTRRVSAPQAPALAPVENRPPPTV
jgi:hypothetical protein